MIPLKLELKNFLSYPEQTTTIDFKEYALICLSGKNGNGKSALLDAMTWAVWGQARKISGAIKPDSGLLRLGQTRMMVSLEFEFGKELYRVRREYAKTYGKPYLALDLEVFDQKNEKFVSLTDKTIKETQSKIEKLLGLDYETFVNSAFLRQGLSDEFSKKSPKERKQILSTILGLSRYDELQRLALEKSKGFQDEGKILSGLKEQAQIEIEKKKEFALKLDQEGLELKQLNRDYQNLQKNLEGLEKEKSLLLQKKQEYEFLLNQKEKLNKDFKIRRDDFENLVIEWKQIHYRSLHLPDIAKLEKERFELEKKEKENLRLQKESLSIQDMILQTRERYQKAVADLKKRQDEELKYLRLSCEKKELEKSRLLDVTLMKEKVLKELESKLEQQKDQICKIQKSLLGRNQCNKYVEQIRFQFEKRRAFYQLLLQKANWIKSHLYEFEQNKIRIQEQKSPSCPLCEQVLTIKRKKFLGAKFEKELALLKHRFFRISNLIEKLKDILFAQHEELKQIVSEQDDYKKLEVTCAELERNGGQIEKEFAQVSIELKSLEKEKREVEKLLAKEKEELKIVEKHFNADLKNNKKIKDLFLTLEYLEKKKNVIGYDEKGHNQILKRIDDIEKKLKELSTIKDDLSKQKERMEKVKILSSQLKELKKVLFEFDWKVKRLDFDQESIKELEEKISTLQNGIAEKLSEKEKKLQEFGSTKNELSRIERVEKENRLREEHLEILKEKVEDYQVLAQAFGKNGIQALLIEQAIPQIEEEANNILSRLTDNQSQIFIESLRDLKSGGVKETLDIQISDSVGIRPYEMFSGGEVFRVDFALRIAISKLLVRRAGTALQTLIIDEGFGSQDEDGLSRLMDAIYAIKKDFSKVIVVSHLTNFKDNFPVHFVVEKATFGSFIRVEQRG